MWVHVSVSSHPERSFLDRHSLAAWVKGVAFDPRGMLMSGSDIAKASGTLKCRQDALRWLAELNGFFALVIQRGVTTYAAVDRVRSVPLFYCETGSGVVISDDPHSIQDELSGRKLDLFSTAEFLLTGYVTGSDTLDPRIRQLQSGELLIVEHSDGGLRTEVLRYYEYRHASSRDVDADTLVRQLDEAVLSSVRRLMVYAAGRRIAIPLSGGLDSRLLAMCLRRLGYNDVVAYTYGTKGCWESRVSHSVADQLQIPWHFVEYTPEKWRRWFASREFEQYVGASECLVSAAHIQDFPAVHTLMSAGVLTQDTVVAPGHSADFVAGSHIPEQPSRMVHDRVDMVVQQIRQDHYCLFDHRYVASKLGLIPSDLQEELRHKISRLLDGFIPSNLSRAVDAYEYWDWQERQSKFIVNSVRVYDFLGCDWWLPWWDAEFMYFWQHVPLRYRLGKSLYNDYVHRVENELSIRPAGTTQQACMKLMRSMLTRMGVLRLCRNMRDYAHHLLRWRELLQSHPMAWYGAVEPSLLPLLRRPGSSINTILTLRQVERWLQSCHAVCVSRTP